MQTFLRLNLSFFQGWIITPFYLIFSKKKKITWLCIKLTEAEWISSIFIFLLNFLMHPKHFPILKKVNLVTYISWHFSHHKQLFQKHHFKKIRNFFEFVFNFKVYFKQTFFEFIMNNDHCDLDWSLRSLFYC